MPSGLKQHWQELKRFYSQHNGFTVLLHHYERHFTPLGKALFLLFLISLSLGMVGTEVLIYMFLCALAALWLASLLVGLHSRPRRSSVQIDWPQWLQAGQAYHWQLQLQNLNPRPSFRLRLEALLKPAKGPAEKLVCTEELFYLPARGQARASFSWQPLRRGLYQLKSLELVSDFPLGLLLWRRQLKRQDQFWVYPAFAELPPQSWQTRSLLQAAGLQQGAALSGDSQEFHGIRPWLPGDSPRLIHWPALARSGQLAVREYQEFPGLQIALLLVTEPSCPEPSFEKAVSVTASLVYQFSQDAQQKLVLSCLGSQINTYLQAGLPFEALMRQLAGISQSEATELEPFWQQLSQLSCNLVICVSLLWSPELGKLAQRCQQRRLGFEILAIGQEVAGFPASARFLPVGQSHV